MRYLLTTSFINCFILYKHVPAGQRTKLIHITIITYLRVNNVFCRLIHSRCCMPRLRLRKAACQRVIRSWKLRCAAAFWGNWFSISVQWSCWNRVKRHGCVARKFHIRLELTNSAFRVVGLEVQKRTEYSRFVVVVVGFKTVKHFEFNTSYCTNEDW